MLCLLVISFLISVSSASVISDHVVERAVRQADFKNYIRADPGQGSATNCGIAKNFSMTWSPKEPSPRGSLTAELNFISPYEFENGKAQVDVYLKEMPEQPIFQVDQDANCNMAKQYIPTLTCPLKAGQLVHYKYTVEKMPALPAGQYNIKAQLLNSKGQQVLCAKAYISIGV